MIFLLDTTPPAACKVLLPGTIPIVSMLRTFHELNPVLAGKTQPVYEYYPNLLFHSL